MKLSRISSNENGISHREANILLAAGRVRINGEICRKGACYISRFREVCIDQKIIQRTEPAYYLMLNKPAGYLSATEDPTVMELIEPALRHHLHIGGRLDRASSFNTGTRDMNRI